MLGITPTQRNHISSVESFERQIWIVIYIENRIGKTQATLLTFIFIIPGATTFTTFTQVSPSMNYDSFVITQDNFSNTYLVTNLVPLILACTKVPFARNITGIFTPTALQTQSTVIENIESLKSFSWQGWGLIPITFISPSLKRNKVSYKFKLK